MKLFYNEFTGALFDLKNAAYGYEVSPAALMPGGCNTTLMASETYPLRAARPAQRTEENP